MNSDEANPISPTEGPESEEIIHSVPFFPSNNIPCFSQTQKQGNGVYFEAECTNTQFGPIVDSLEIVEYLNQINMVIKDRPVAARTETPSNVNHSNLIPPKSIQPIQQELPDPQLINRTTESSIISDSENSHLQNLQSEEITHDFSENVNTPGPMNPSVSVPSQSIPLKFPCKDNFHPLIKSFIELPEIQEELLKCPPEVTELFMKPTLDTRFNHNMYDETFLNQHFNTQDYEKWSEFNLHAKQLLNNGKGKTVNTSRSHLALPLSVQLHCQEIDASIRLTKFLLPDCFVDDLTSNQYKFKFTKDEFHSFMIKAEQYHAWKIHKNNPTMEYHYCKRHGKAQVDDPDHTYLTNCPARINVSKKREIVRNHDGSIAIDDNGNEIQEDVYYVAYRWRHNHSILNLDDLRSEPLLKRVVQYLKMCHERGDIWPQVHKRLRDLNFSTNIENLDQASKVEYYHYYKKRKISDEVVTSKRQSIVSIIDDINKISSSGGLTGDQSVLEWKDMCSKTIQYMELANQKLKSEECTVDYSTMMAEYVDQMKNIMYDMRDKVNGYTKSKKQPRC